MSLQYAEFPGLNLPAIEKEILDKWNNGQAFEKSVSLREGSKPFVFYEGPPSANGMPGIHHVISRTLKDMVCRYKTMQGFQVKRKGGWDTHGNNFKTMAEKLPQLDAGVSAMIGDLCDRGLDKDVAVVMWGEFGRTPKVNKSAGRDHWPKVTSALLAGGGMRTGQAVGKTDREAGEVVDRPVQFGEVFATLYATLGIDTSKVTLPDLSGRPQYLVEGGCLPMHGLAPTRMMEIARHLDKCQRTPARADICHTAALHRTRTRHEPPCDRRCRAHGLWQAQWRPARDPPRQPAGLCRGRVAAAQRCAGGAGRRPDRRMREPGR